MIILYIILIIAALIMLLLLLPARCVIMLNSDGGEILLKYLFFKYRLYPSGEIKRDVEKDIKEEKEEEKKDDKSGNVKRQLKILRTLISDILKTLKRLLKYTVNHAVTVEQFSISAVFGTEDPASAGMLCGMAYSAVYSAITVMQNNMKLKNYSVNITPDFYNSVFSGGVYIRIRTRIAHMIVLLFTLLNLVIKYILTARKIT